MEQCTTTLNSIDRPTAILSSGRGLDPLPGLLAIAGPRHQVEFLGSADGGPAIVDSQFGINVLGVGSHSIQRHDEPAGNVWAVKVAPEQSKNVNFARAQWLDQALLVGSLVLGRQGDGEQSTNIPRGESGFRDRSKQGCHRLALIGEDLHVALGLGQRQRPFAAAQPQPRRSPRAWWISACSTRISITLPVRAPASAAASSRARRVCARSRESAARVRDGRPSAPWPR